MNVDGWITVGTVAGVLLLLMATNIGADLVMLAGLTVLLTTGVLTTSEALAGFANEGMLTVAVLFVVATALRETGGMALLAGRLLGRPKSATAAQARLMIPVATMSAFTNNTPLVAMMLPVVSEWAKGNRLSPSKLMMPLSFATILGGLCTMLGTSTNVVVNGLWTKAGNEPMHLFAMAPLGVPCAIIGIAFMLLTSRWLLPERKSAISVNDDPRQYTVEMLVEPGSGLVGQTIEQAGLRHLSGMYLIEIDRDGEVHPAVGPEEKLEANDRLVFVGVVESVAELQKIRGLRPATNQVFKLGAERSQRRLIEAVVSHSCRIVGQTIREGQFRTLYNAVVIAVARDGVRIRKKIGDIELEPGDQLLLEAHPSFLVHHRNSRDFYLVSQLEDYTPPRHDRAWLAMIILVGMIVTAAMGWLSMLNAAMVAAGLMLATRCLSGAIARRNIDWQVLAVIGAAFGIGTAMEKTGTARIVADAFVSVGEGNPWLTLAIVYALTMMFTELLSNNAAAVLVFPIAMNAAKLLDVSPLPFVMAMMVAASCGFATPIGYQTNLMVMGPGGYRFIDFVRLGGPLNLVVGAVTVAIVPFIWPFAPTQ